MAFLINPNIAYLLVVTGIMLLLWTFNNPKSNWPKVLMVVCFMAAAYEFVFLKENPWAFLVVALSPLPFSHAIQQKLPRSPLYLITTAMLVLGSVFLFVDENNSPVVDYGLAAIVSMVCASLIWIGVERLRSVEGAILSNDPDSVVGLIGETRSEIESHSAGSVRIEGELWQARSKKPIPAGSTVRVVRQDGFVLTVKETENQRKKEVIMPLEQHQEKNYPKDLQSIYEAALKATEKLGGKIISSAPEQYRLTARFPKVILGKTLGERTELSCQFRAEGTGGVAVVDAFPLDAVERKLMFGARPGVTLTVVTWFLAHLEHNLGIPPAQ